LIQFLRFVYLCYFIAPCEYNTGHSYGPKKDTMEIEKVPRQGKYLNTLEKYYVFCSQNKINIWTIFTQIVTTPSSTLKTTVITNNLQHSLHTTTHPQTTWTIYNQWQYYMAHRTEKLHHTKHMVCHNTNHKKIIRHTSRLKTMIHAKTVDRLSGSPNIGSIQTT
jgi:hypothetical protein